MKSIITSILLLSILNSTKYEPGQWIIDNSSQLLIHGQTNLNTFTCYISCYNNLDTIEYDYDTKNNQLIFKSNKMIIPIYSFNCGNSLITKDFRETVNIDKFPYLNISFISLVKSKDDDNIQGKMQIELAGVTRQVNVQFRGKYVGNFFQLSGTQHLCFSDFRIKPPERLMGLVKVQEALTVEFDLLIKQIKD